MRIRKGDTVVVLAGDDAGRQGKVLKVFPKRYRAIVEGVNFIKRHTRPNRSNQQGGIVEKEASLHMSNIALICSRCDQRTRIGVKILEDGGRVRVCRKCGEMMTA
ncbi:MAG: 50S ribosomal protein L24 [Candidatus Latescibacteria bacterium]|nr:50S ribosomal protein L24 [Candidatus Latescibacterota bacterium]